MNFFNKGFIITNDKGDICLSDISFQKHVDTNQVYSIITDYFEEFNKVVFNLNLVEWALSVIESNQDYHNQTLLMTDQQVYRLTAKRFTSPFSLAFNDSFNTDSSEFWIWQLMSSTYAEQMQVPRWLNILPTGVSIYNFSEDRLIYINDYAQKLYNYPKAFWYNEGSIRKKWESLIHTSQRKKISLLADSFLKSERQQGFLKYRIVNGHGASRYVREQYYKVLNEKNQITELITSVHDITHEFENAKKVQSILRKEVELNELRSNMINIVAHELRSPLGVVQLSSDLIKSTLEKEIPDLNYIKKNSDRISRHADQLNNIITDFAETVGKSAVKLKLNFVNIELNEFINNLVDDLAASFGISIKLFLPDEPIVVFSDKQALTIILTNLISNAYKYSQSIHAPELRIEKKPNNLAEIHVTDFGIGIPENEQKFIFDSFYRASNAKAFNGLGLGLSNTKDLVELLNATLSFKSKLNEFTTFTVTLNMVSP